MLMTNLHRAHFSTLLFALLIFLPTPASAAVQLGDSGSAPFLGSSLDAVGFDIYGDGSGSIYNISSIGIATSTAPSVYKLEVHGGNAYFSGSITAGGSVTATGGFLGPLTGALNASYVSAGIFGSSSTKGNYTFQAAANTNPVLFVDATNERVGIGTTNPYRKFQVSAGVQPFMLTTSDYNNSTTGSTLVMEFGTATGNTYSMIGALSAGGSVWNNLILQPGGNVGIGTTGPDSKLHIIGGVCIEATDTGCDTSVYSSNADELVLGKNEAVNTGLTIISGTGNQGNIYFNDADDSTFRGAIRYDHADDSLGLWESGGEKLTIDGGNVGIGTVGPDNYLHIEASNVGELIALNLEKPVANPNVDGPILAFSYNEEGSSPVETGDNTGMIGFRASYANNAYSGYGAAIKAKASGSQSVSASGGQLEFWTTDDGTTVLDQRMTIDDAGNVGIGTASPDAKLDVNGDLNVTGQIFGGNDLTTQVGSNYVSLSPFSGSIELAWDGNFPFIDFKNNPADDSDFRLQLRGDDSFSLTGGNVGIGTTGPTIDLAIGDTDTGLNWVSDGILQAYANNQAIAQFTTSGIDLNKTVTIAASNKLVFGNHTSTNDHIQLYGAGGATQYGIGVEGSTTYYRSGTYHRWYIGTLADAGVSDKMELTSSGLTVNGTITSTGVLAANAGISVDGSMVIDDAGGWHRSYGGTGWYNGTYGGGIWMQGTSYVEVYGGKGFLVPTGKVGIGTTGPLSTLSVGGAGIANAGVYGSGTTYGVYGSSTTYGVYGTGTSEGVRGYSSAGKGVYGQGSTYGVYGGGSTAGVYGTSVSKGVYGYSLSGYGVYGNSNSGSGLRGNSNSGYGIYCNAGTNPNGCGGNRAWYNASDERLKTNIMTLEKPLEKVLALRGVNFEWENIPGKTQMGFIAQEVMDVVPEVVGTDPDGYYTMAQSELTALLVEAIKEQQKQIESLKTDIEELKKK